MGGPPGLSSPTAGGQKRREESKLILTGRLPLSKCIEVWLAIRGEGYALLDQLPVGRITGGVAVLHTVTTSRTRLLRACFFF